MNSAVSNSIARLGYRCLLLLVISNGLLVTGYCLIAAQLTGLAQLAVPFGLVTFNLLLRKQILIHVLNHKRHYVLYPAIVTAMILALAILNALFITG